MAILESFVEAGRSAPHTHIDGLRTYRVRRFRIVYATDQKGRAIRLMAVGHRRYVYEELTEQLRRKTRK